MAQNSVSKTTVITTFQSLDEEMEPQNQPKDYLRTSGFLGGPTSTEKKRKRLKISPEKILPEAI